MCTKIKPYMICACCASRTDVCFQLRNAKEVGVDPGSLYSDFTHGRNSNERHGTKVSRILYIGIVNGTVKRYSKIYLS